MTNPEARTPTATSSIFSAGDSKSSEQVRPTLDHLVELTCKAIVRDAKHGRLAIKAVQR